MLPAIHAGVQTAALAVSTIGIISDGIGSLFGGEPAPQNSQYTYAPHAIPDTADLSQRSMQEYQIEMERMFHKNQVIPRIKAEFMVEEEELRNWMLQWDIDFEFGINLMVHMAIHKRAEISTMVGILKKHFQDTEEKSAAQQCADMIFKAGDADLVNWDPTIRKLVIGPDISKEVRDELDRYQYPMPMIVEPKTIKSNRDTGYLTSRGSVILKNNHHELDVCLDHLNKMNRVKLRINLATAKMVKNSWRALTKRKKDQTQEEFQLLVKAFNKFDRTSKDVIQHLEIAGNEFYLTHKYDKRGRVYSQGYHVNYQGHDWNKAVIEFANGETIDG